MAGAMRAVGSDNRKLYRAGERGVTVAGRSFAARGRIQDRAPVAQLDRVLVSEAKGHRFDSCRARHYLAVAQSFFRPPGYTGGYG